MPRPVEGKSDSQPLDRREVFSEQKRSAQDDRGRFSLSQHARLVCRKVLERQQVGERIQEPAYEGEPDEEDEKPRISRSRPRVVGAEHETERTHTDAEPEAGLHPARLRTGEELVEDAVHDGREHRPAESCPLELSAPARDRDTAEQQHEADYRRRRDLPAQERTESERDERRRGQDDDGRTGTPGTDSFEQPEGGEGKYERDEVRIAVYPPGNLAHDDDGHQSGKEPSENHQLFGSELPQHVHEWHGKPGRQAYPQHAEAAESDVFLVTHGPPPFCVFRVMGAAKNFLAKEI